MTWLLLHKYLSGESSPKEENEVEKWINKNDANRRLFQSLENIWKVEPSDEIKVDAREAWNSFKQKIPGEDNQRNEAPLNDLNSIRSTSIQRSRYSRSVAASISVAAVMMISILMYFFMPRASISDEEFVQDQPTMQQISTEPGQRSSFQLSDGTRVQLNTDSKIVVPSSFGDSLRSVELTGEAYFEVAQDQSKPFIVDSEYTYTRVLGTKFGVKAYSEDEQVQVVVEEGKVEIGSVIASEEEAQHLEKNQVGLLHENGQKKVLQLDSVGKYLGWKDGRLIYDSTPFGEVIPELERWYNIKIDSDTSLHSKTLTSSFTDEPVTEVLNIISLSLDIDYKREGRKITFSSNKKNSLK